MSLGSIEDGSRTEAAGGEAVGVGSGASSSSWSAVALARRTVDRSIGVQLAAGFVAGALQTAFWHPLDVIKTRLQVQDVRAGHTPPYRSLRDAVVTMVRVEGVRSFYQGVTPGIAGSAVGWGVHMPLYNAFKKAFDDGCHPSSSSSSPRERKAPRLGRDLMCSLASGSCATLCVHPIYLVKTRLQLQAATIATGATSARQYQGPLHAVSSILREEGAIGLYRGFGPSILLSSHGAVLVVAYDQLKAVIPSTMVASALAKIFACMSTYPVQVVRSVMQQRPVQGHSVVPEGAWAVAGQLWRSAGIRAFYRGLSAQMLRTVPQAVCFFSIYEVIVERFPDAR